ncbi:MAG: DUF4143 domain-containing protein [Nitrospira sp. SB0661_bin_20]|nr:DUF4143 domain-containing protein [Nitrospira sp. SB0661_bin_20]
MIIRDLAPKLIRSATQVPTITLTGPRQSGKTTLCRSVFPRHPYVTLETPDTRAFAAEDPRAFLAQFPEGAVIDEVQRAPDLLSYLQGIIDDDPAPGRWILSGSQNLSLLESVSQSLAGRTAVHHLLPLTRGEITRFPQHPASLDETLFAGGYPRIFDRQLDPADWLRSYVATYLERDVRTLSNVGDLATFQRFVELCAGRTAQLINYSSLANDCGISQPSAKAWLGILEASFVVFRLQAFHANVRKRLVKMPKLYFYDTGLVCWLLGIRQPEQLRSHPLRGAIFETWVISETMKHRTNLGKSGGLLFYRDSNGAEVDLVIEQPGSVVLVEVKSSATASSSLFAGAKRIQRHFGQLPRSSEVVVVYGGDEFQGHTEGRLIPWRMLRAASLLNFDHVISVSSGGRPIAGAAVLGLFSNKTWKGAITGENGESVLDLHSIHLPMTVFVAAEGFAAHLERDWIPAERALHVELSTLSNGGAVILPEGTGTLPGLKGRLNPIRDTLDRTCLYASNIAINEGRQQPVAFVPGEKLGLTDADGHELLVRIIDIVGSSALVEYWRPEEVKG